MPEYALIPESCSLFPYFFVASIPTYFLNFKFFNHSSIYMYVCMYIYILWDLKTGYLYYGAYIITILCVLHLQEICIVHWGG